MRAETVYSFPLASSIGPDPWQALHICRVSEWTSQARLEARVCPFSLCSYFLAQKAGPQLGQDLISREGPNPPPLQEVFALGPRS